MKISKIIDVIKVGIGSYVKLGLYKVWHYHIRTVVAEDGFVIF